MLFLARLTEQSQGEEKAVSALTPKLVALETVALTIVTPELAAPATLQPAALDAAAPKLIEPQMIKQEPVERVFAEQQTTKQTTPATGKKDTLHSVLTASRSGSARDKNNISRYRAGYIVDRSSYDWAVNGRGISIQKHF